MDLFREIIALIFDSILGWGLFLGVLCLLLIFGRLRERNAKVLRDIEVLKEKAKRQRSDIEKLKRSVQKLGAPISHDELS